MSFVSLLALLFIGLKLAGFIAWSWWLVLSPIFGLSAVFLILVWAGVSFIKSEQK